jgi:galactonate dehydratase
MKIIDIKVFLINKGEKVSFGTGWGKNYIIVKVFTDEDLTGLGEAFGTGKALTEEAAVKEFTRWLIGKDPTEVLKNWYAYYRGSRYPLGTATLSALSAIEQALWDISGKVAGLPIYKMLGGAVRDRIRLYGSSYLVHTKNWDEDDPEYFAEGCREAVRRGFTGIKITPQAPGWNTKSPRENLAESVKRVSIAREAMGPDNDVMIDYHGRSFSPAEAIQFGKSVEEFNIFFLEEPALTENPASLAFIRDNVHIPIAGGERCVTRNLMKELLPSGAIDIFQPEPAANGGIMETIKWAAMAELYHIVLAPHHACGPVSFLANIHIDACVPNFLIQECHVDFESDFIRDVFDHDMVMKNGYLELPDRPGLGIEINEEAVLKYSYKPYDRPVVIMKDGSIGLE